MTPRIDAHHHFWKYTASEYEWISDDLMSLRRDFLPGDLSPLLRASNVRATVAVQARQSLEETEWLLDLADVTPWIAGVVGWLPIASPQFEQELERFTGNCHLKGFRHVVQTEPTGFLEQSAFNAGIRRLRDTGHTYDILIVSRQLPEAIAFVDRHPHQPFILDHLGKPDIRNGELEQWAKHLRTLAERPHVSAKLSGLVTEADPLQWTPATLTPYLDAALEAFGPSRLMVGTDWPVLTVGCTYAAWWSLLEEWIDTLSTDEQASILGGTAQRVYGLGEELKHPTKSSPMEEAKR